MLSVPKMKKMDLLWVFATWEVQTLGGKTPKHLSKEMHLDAGPNRKNYPQLIFRCWIGMNPAPVLQCTQ